MVYARKKASSRIHHKENSRVATAGKIRSGSCATLPYSYVSTPRTLASYLHFASKPLSATTDGEVAAPTCTS